MSAHTFEVIIFGMACATPGVILIASGIRLGWRRLYKLLRDKPVAPPGWYD
jgi:hypothetical protein